MTIHTREQWRIRHATEADVTAIVELQNACSLALTGESCTTATQVAGFLNAPTTDPALDTWLCFTPDDQLIGYGDFSDRPPHVSLWSWISVHPDYQGCGIEAELIHLTEARAREVIPQAPADTRVALYRRTLDQEPAMRDLLVTHGYDLIRHSWRMRIELDDAPPAPVFPAGMRMRTVDLAHEVPTVFYTMDDCFKDHWGHVDTPEEYGLGRFQYYIDHNPFFDSSLWFLAVKDTPDGEDIAGLALCDPRMVSDPDMAYVTVLGVKRAWRRQGIGLAMLHYVFGEFYRRGMPRAALHVDAQSLTGATRLYEKAGMHVDQQYQEFEKELRAGDNLMTQTVD